MSHYIVEQLRSVEGDFLDAIITNALPTFEPGWVNIHFHLRDMAAGSKLDHRTASLAHNSVAKVMTMAQTFLNIETTADALGSNLMAQIQDTISRMSLHCDAPPTPPSTPPSSSSTLEPTSQASYIATCNKWLMQNLHNPYPSTELKEKMAKEVNADPKCVNAWFNNVRKRMGWTRIQKEFFRNCRQSCIAAAHRTLVERKPIDDGHNHAFIQMRSTAQELYAEKFTKSELANVIDAVVKTMTPEERARVDEEKRQTLLGAKAESAARKEQERAQKVLDRAAAKAAKAQERRAAAAGASSPRYSSSPSPSSSASPQSAWDEEEDTTPPPPVAGRKRRADEDAPTEFNFEAATRVVKRLRSGPSAAQAPVSPVLTSDDSFTDLFTSPTTNHYPQQYAASIMSTDVDWLNSLIASTSAPAPTPTGSRKRGRCVSESESGGAPKSKRQRGPVPGPRHQAVSAPIPDAAWDFFEVPPAATVDFDSSIPLEFNAMPTYDAFHSSVPLAQNFLDFLHQPAPSFSSYFPPTPDMSPAPSPADILASHSPVDTDRAAKLEALRLHQESALKLQAELGLDGSR